MKGQTFQKKVVSRVFHSPVVFGGGAWHPNQVRLKLLSAIVLLALVFFASKARADFLLTILATLNGTTDGGYVVGLTQGQDGNFYGVTHQNGTYDGGTVFKMTPSGSLTILVDFDGTNGANPKGPIIQGVDGNFYGVADTTAFRMTTNGTMTVLTVFNPTNGPNPPFDFVPNSPLAQGRDGNFYGTTPGGLGNYGGTVFKVTASGQLTVLVSFMFTNGYLPTSGLVLGNDGNFYGTTSGRDVGASVRATVFKITPEGALTTLVYVDPTNDVADTPGLVLGPDGIFYGMTTYGTTHASEMVYKVTPSGNLTTLARFTNNGPYNLVLGKDGNFYGTAGNPNRLFQMTPDGAFTTITSLPLMSTVLMAGNDGNLYGAAGNAIYRVVPPPLFQTATKAGGYVTLTWSAAIGQSYQPQYTTSLLSTNWTSLGAPITATNLTVTVSDSPGSNAQRFYRVQLLP